YDRAGMRNLGNAAKAGGVLGDQLEQFLEQYGEGHHSALAKIDHALLDTVTLRAPAIFAHEKGGIMPPALVLSTQAIEQPEDAAKQRSDGDTVLDERANIGNAHLERGEARRRTQVPPDLGGVLDQSGADEKLDGAFIFTIARKLMRDAGARQLVEHREPVGFEPGLDALPERRGGREREQMRQEIGGLTKQVDAQIVVLDADMDMHARNHEPSPDLLEVVGNHIVALLVGVLL